jgi:hypothetical protein
LQESDALMAGGWDLITKLGAAGIGWGRLQSVRLLVRPFMYNEISLTKSDCRPWKNDKNS